MQPLNPATELSVVLSAQDWNEVIDILARSTVKPYVSTAPLIQRIGAQVQQRAAELQQPPPARPPNGADEAGALTTTH